MAGCDQNPQYIRLQLVGDGPEKPSLVRKARDDGLTNVRFLDPVPKEQVYRLLTDSDALVLVLRDAPLFRWGVSPNKLFDYFAAARPVIFGVATPYDPVQQAQAGISVGHPEPHALAEAMVSLSRMSAEDRWKMGMRGRKYVEENHDMARLAARLEEILLASVVRAGKT